MAVVRHKAAIHSGHFMVSDFEPDEQDEEDAETKPKQMMTLLKNGVKVMIKSNQDA